MTTKMVSLSRMAGRGVHHADFPGLASGYLRECLGNRFIYLVVSSRARGLSIGVNINPDRRCNFNCGYCEVNRNAPAAETALEVEIMAAELQRTLTLIASGSLHNLEPYRHMPPELLRLRYVALSGDGEPTLSPVFLDAVRTVTHVRALQRTSFFKMVLLTNATHLDAPLVQEGLKLFLPEDEIWAKLEAGTQGYFDKVNQSNCSLEKIMANILLVARQRPVVIQSLFPLLNHEEPPVAEIEQYALRLRELKDAGAKIPLVQIYSATRPAVNSGCGHLPLNTLAGIAERVRQVSGLKAEVF